MARTKSADYRLDLPTLRFSPDLGAAAAGETQNKIKTGRWRVRNFSLTTWLSGVFLKIIVIFTLGGWHNDPASCLLGRSSSRSSKFGFTVVFIFFFRSDRLLTAALCQPLPIRRSSVCRMNRTPHVLPFFFIQRFRFAGGRLLTLGSRSTSSP